MDSYLKVTQEIVNDLKKFKLTKISRGGNTAADALATLASTSDHDLRIIMVENIAPPSIYLSKGVCQITKAPAENNDAEAIAEPMDEGVEPDKDWRDEIRLYITNGVLPKDKWALVDFEHAAPITPCTKISSTVGAPQEQCCAASMEMRYLRSCTRSMMGAASTTPEVDDP